MKRKITILILVFTLTFGVASCGDASNEKLSPEQQVAKMRGILQDTLAAVLDESLITTQTLSSQAIMPATWPEIAEDLYLMFLGAAELLLEQNGVNALDQTYNIPSASSAVFAEAVQKKLTTVTPVMLQFVTAVDVYGLKDDAIYGKLVINLSGMYLVSYVFKTWFNSQKDFGFVCHTTYEHEYIDNPSPKVYATKINEIVWTFDKHLSSFKHYELSVATWSEENGDTMFNKLVLFTEWPYGPSVEYVYDSNAASTQIEEATPILIEIDALISTLESETAIFPEKTVLHDWIFN